MISTTTQDEKRLFLIERLLSEQPRYKETPIPREEPEQKQLLRALFNVRPPARIGQDFLDVQDAYLREETAKKGITNLADLSPISEGVYLWQGDITTLRCDAIVNAANSGMTGCYVPGHNCIDNCIHTFAGVQLRLACAELMARQGHEEETGTAKLTPAYNLPCKYVLHTVGPIVEGRVMPEDERLLASCYCSCLELAERNGIKSIAFCCISTGVFRFPKDRAAEIAVQTVKEYRERINSDIEVIFNVHMGQDVQFLFHKATQFVIYTGHGIIFHAYIGPAGVFQHKKQVEIPNNVCRLLDQLRRHGTVQDLCPVDNSPSARTVDSAVKADGTNGFRNIGLQTACAQEYFMTVCSGGPDRRDSRRTGRLPRRGERTVHIEKDQFTHGNTCSAQKICERASTCWGGRPLGGVYRFSSKNFCIAAMASSSAGPSAATTISLPCLMPMPMSFIS